jgi:hypothetical protein
VAKRRDGRRIIGSKELTWLPLVLFLTASCCALEAYAEDLKSASAHFADQSFALLDQLSKQSSDNPNPLLGLVASFSGDADSLRQSLARSDLRSASSNIASLQADRTAVDQALKLHPNAVAAEEWSALRQQVDKLASEIPPCGVHADCGPAPTAASGAGSAPLGSISGAADSPRIEIASREYGDGIVRLTGYFEGTALKSAGIYDGAQCLKEFKVNRAPGRQRVEFDLRLENPSATTVLLVADSDDRIAEAPAIDPSLPSPPASEISAGGAPSTAFPDEDEAPRSSDEDAGGVAEIPSHGPLMPSPSKRHTLGSKLGDVRINLLGVTRVRNLPPTYEIIGQISGRGITRAGIYLDGRLLQPIPITDSANYTSFDQRIVAQSGSTTIRAYNVGNQFIEQSVDLFDAEDTSELADYRDGTLVTATPMSAAGIAVQITGIRPVAGSLYVVSGIISGPDIVSAGLYQNGVLAQSIALASGLAGALGALIPGSSRSINFNARFNPYAGPATVRAFNSTGACAEQPVVVAGVSPSGAPWPTSPYSGPGNLPFGGGSSASPYGNRLGPTRPLW